MTIDAVLSWLATATAEDAKRARDAAEERLVALDVCEHAVATGDWCPACNAEYKRARREHGDDDG